MCGGWRWEVWGEWRWEMLGWVEVGGVGVSGGERCVVCGMSRGGRCVG